METMDELEKAFSKKYNWDEDKCGEELNNENK